MPKRSTETGVIASVGYQHPSEVQLTAGIADTLLAIYAAYQFMNQWNQFNHPGVCEHLKAIVEKAQSMGAQVGSCGESKITIQWPEGETVFVRRFREGPYRWLLFTASKYQALILVNRDPSIRELMTALQD